MKFAQLEPPIPLVAQLCAFVSLSADFERHGDFRQLACSKPNTL
jgi:hypothetical protein